MNYFVEEYKSTLTRFNIRNSRIPSSQCSNAVLSSRRNTFCIPTPENLDKMKFNKLPFYPIKSVIIKPTLLCGNKRSTSIFEGKITNCENYSYFEF